MPLIIRTKVGEYTNKDLARIYECSTRTISRNIAKIKDKLGERKGYRWSSEQVQIIFDNMDRPYEIIEIASFDELKKENVEMKFYPQQIAPEKKIAS